MNATKKVVAKIRAERCEKWNFERDFDLKTRNVESTGDMFNDTDLRDASDSLAYWCFTSDSVPKADPNVRVGDIRLLGKDLVPGWFGYSVIVAVASDWDDGEFVISPYSPYSEPATTTEVVTGRSGEFARVICPWCSLSVSKELLVKSSLLGQMSNEERRVNWKVFLHASLGEDLDETLLSLVGSHVGTRYDLRVAWQDELSSLMLQLA